ncbi:Threonyl-tRNA synthetase, partial [sediment metagenome]
MLHGLLRVRGFTQDDAHLFIREDQIEAEMAACLRFGLDLLSFFGFANVKAFLATRPADFMGELAAWNDAEAAIKRVLDAAGMPYEVDEGGGAFYGPKIDLKIRDAIGREWQCTTFQLDFQMPQRFELEYVAQDGSRKRPIMIHRALFGSVERFIAVLIEQYAGAFPMWLAPVQARVITVSEKAEAYGREVEAVLRAADLRVEADLSADKLNAKIRRAQLEKIPYMLVVGERDMAAPGGVAANPRRQAAARGFHRRAGEDLGRGSGGPVARRWPGGFGIEYRQRAGGKSIARPGGYHGRGPVSATDNYRVGRRIRVPEVRVIGADGGQVGIVPTHEALRMAEDLGLDLVEVSPRAVPPVCRIMDFGRFKYQESKKEKASRKHQSTVVLKEIKFRPKTDTHDLDFKLKHIRRFLGEGNKVRLMIVFRGREIVHPETGQAVLDLVSKEVA